MVDLVLDTNIRDWVLLPIVVIMLLVTLLRGHVQALIKDNEKVDAEQLELRNTLARAQRLRANGRFISPAAFAMRKAHFIDEEEGSLTRTDLPSAAAQGMGNPTAMLGGMKGNVAYMVQNLFMITWVSNFFTGFVLVKVPFPLTMRFKSMTQRGVDLATLDASYISSLSWYFIVMFGLNRILPLFTGGPGGGVSDEERMMQMQMGMVGGGQRGFDAKKSFSTERDNLQLAKQDFLLGIQEKSLAEIYRKEGTA